MNTISLISNWQETVEHSQPKITKTIDYEDRNHYNEDYYLVKL